MTTEMAAQRTEAKLQGVQEELDVAQGLNLGLQRRIGSMERQMEDLSKKNMHVLKEKSTIEEQDRKRREGKKNLEDSMVTFTQFTQFTQLTPPILQN